MSFVSGRKLCFSASKKFVFPRHHSTLPPVATFTKLSEGTPEDFRRAQIHFANVVTPESMTNRVMNMVKSLKGIYIGNEIDMYEHSVQTATRALEDGADIEVVVCGLLHDVGEVITPACHGEVAASLLRPYISTENHWILSHHEIFQAFYYGSAMNINPNIRDNFRSSPFFDACEKFCGKYDENSFDPGFKSAPLETFEPLVLEVLSRKPYMADNACDDMSKAKKALGVYDFEDWNKTNQ